MIKHNKMTMLFLFVITLASCSFVSLDPMAENVIVSPDAASLKSCKFLGNTTVSLWSKASTFQSDTTVNTQLDTLARNQAAAMGGNTVVSYSKINNGEETYSVYKCVSHDANNISN